MTREPVTVVIPVGPEPHHRTWLGEAVISVAEQSSGGDRVLLINDGGPPIPASWVDDLQGQLPMVTENRMPWCMGVTGAFNAGVGLSDPYRHGAADSDLVLMIGGDDKLLPGAIDACVETWEAHDRADGYYWMTIEYSDDRADKIQALPCHAVMVTRGLWDETGGFPPETASGAPDAAFISMLMVHKPEALIPVKLGDPLYWVRVHENQDTAGRGPWQPIIMSTRDLLTKRGFQP